jgi:predicted DNA-binding ribbon-helix-helix protein
MIGATFRKRSLSVDGHRTSVALEGSFWEALEEIAGQRGISLPALVREVDRKRSAPEGGRPPGLASALRLHALAELRAALRGEPSSAAPPRSPMTAPNAAEQGSA